MPKEDSGKTTTPTKTGAKRSRAVLLRHDTTDDDDHGIQVLCKRSTHDDEDEDEDEDEEEEEMSKDPEQAEPPKLKGKFWWDESQGKACYFDGSSHFADRVEAEGGFLVSYWDGPKVKARWASEVPALGNEALLAEGPQSIGE
eukprot:12610890-Alexandrium_andersonii.AAC.1